MKKNVILVEIITKLNKIVAKSWNYWEIEFTKKYGKMEEILPFVKLKFGPSTIGCRSK